ncbi:MAG: hypothetical protein HOE90_23020 [Bacteriovoracaceae bacterium]|nr:hypothetical protein [Bacteriovoracaceae bacterium]
MNISDPDDFLASYAVQGRRQVEVSAEVVPEGKVEVETVARPEQVVDRSPRRTRRRGDDGLAEVHHGDTVGDVLADVQSSGIDTPVFMRVIPGETAPRSGRTISGEQLTSSRERLSTAADGSDPVATRAAELSLIDETSIHLEQNGVAHEIFFIGTPADGQLGIRIIPDNSTPLGKFAKKNERRYGIDSVYRPGHLAESGAGGGHIAGESIILSDDAMDALRHTAHIEGHESLHAKTFSELTDGVPAPWYGSAQVRSGGGLGGGAYSQYLSFDEMRSYGFNLDVQLSQMSSRARKGKYTRGRFDFDGDLEFLEQVMGQQKNMSGTSEELIARAIETVRTNGGFSYLDSKKTGIRYAVIDVTMPDGTVVRIKEPMLSKSHGPAEVMEGLSWKLAYAKQQKAVSEFGLEKLELIKAETDPVKKQKMIRALKESIHGTPAPDSSAAPLRTHADFESAYAKALESRGSSRSSGRDGGGGHPETGSAEVATDVTLTTGARRVEDGAQVADSSIPARRDVDTRVTESSVPETVIRTEVEADARLLDETALDRRIVSVVDETTGTTMPEIATFDDGTRAIRKWNDPQEEVAAYILDRELGLEMVPATIMKVEDGMPYSLQRWVEDADMAKTRYEHAIVSGVDPASLGLVRGSANPNLRFFDFLIGNSDRNLKNFLINPDGTLVAIDHGGAFGKAARKRDVPSLDELIPDKAFYDKIVGLEEQRLRSLLGEHLSDDQIEGIIKRRKLIVEEVERFTQLNGHSPWKTAPSSSDASSGSRSLITGGDDLDLNSAAPLSDPGGSVVTNVPVRSQVAGGSYPETRSATTQYDQYQSSGQTTSRGERVVLTSVSARPGSYDPDLRSSSSLADAQSELFLASRQVRRGNTGPEQLVTVRDSNLSVIDATSDYLRAKGVDHQVVIENHRGHESVGVVITPIRGSPAGRLALRLKEKYDLDLIYLPEVNEKIGAKGFFYNDNYIAVSHGFMKKIDKAGPTELHEIIHAQSIFELRQGKDTPWGGKFKVSGEGKLIGSNGYDSYVSVDEVRTHTFQTRLMITDLLGDIKRGDLTAGSPSIVGRSNDIKVKLDVQRSVASSVAYNGKLVLKAIEEGAKFRYKIDPQTGLPSYVVNFKLPDGSSIQYRELLPAGAPHSPEMALAGIRKKISIAEEQMIISEEALAVADTLTGVSPEARHRGLKSLREILRKRPLPGDSGHIELSKSDFRALVRHEGEMAEQTLEGATRPTLAAAKRAADSRVSARSAAASSGDSPRSSDVDETWRDPEEIETAQEPATTELDESDAVTLRGGDEADAVTVTDVNDGAEGITRREVDEASGGDHTSSSDSGAAVVLVRDRASNDVVDIPITSIPAPVQLSTGRRAERALSRGTIADASPLNTGVSRTDRVVMSDGTQAIKKTDLGSREAQREVAAYEFSEIVGLELVPPTVLKKEGAGAYSLQTWVEDGRTAKQWRDYIRAGNTEGLPVKEADLVKRSVDPNLRFFDQIIGNRDRHIRNYMYRPDGTIVAIDNARSFMAGRARPMPNISTKKGMQDFISMIPSAEVYQKFTSASEDSLKRKLGGHLGETELAEFLQRRREFIESATAIEQRAGKPIWALQQTDVDYLVRMAD